MNGVALVFAFTAGMVATVNPCGFALLPAYISIFLTEEEQAQGGARHGLWVGAAVTLGFVLLFSVVGLVVSAGAYVVLDAVPWIALVIGVGLAGLGVAVLRGTNLRLPLPGLSLRREPTFRGMTGFGVAYGVASLSCTLPVFLAVATQALAAPGLFGGWTVFGAYALGMGLVLTTLAVALATSRRSIVERLRGVLPYVQRFGGWLLVLSGLYIVYYWSVNLTGAVDQNSPWYAPVLAVNRVSSALSQLIATRPYQAAALFVAVIVGVVAYERRRRKLALETVETVEADRG